MSETLAALHNFDERGANLWLSREALGLITDGLVAVIAEAKARKGANAESTGDLRVEWAESIIRAFSPTTLTARGVRVGDEGLQAAALGTLVAFRSIPASLAKRHVDMLDRLEEALAATPTPPEIDPTEPHIPRPSDICSVCGNGLVHIDAHRDPATPTPPEIDVEPAPRCGVHTFVTTDVCGCKS